MHPTEPQVGLGIKDIRLKKGLSMRGLASRCGVSVNTISLVERGDNSPTVSTLHQLAQALEVPITDFFEDEISRTIVHVKLGQGIRYNYETSELENLGVGLQNQQLEPFRLTVAPGSSSCDEPVSHPGQEFVYCLDGEIDYYVNNHRYQMGHGDSLLFQASQQHCWRNTTHHPATILLIFQAATESHLARLSHLEAG